MSLPRAYLQEFYAALTPGETKQAIATLKTRLAEKHGLSRVPTDHELLLGAPEELRPGLMSKPVRTQSGVAVVAVMTAPRACSHGTCIMCPGGPGSVFGDVPQSYTGREPASMRAGRNAYDAYLQVFNRLEQYLVLGHEPGKVELIVMGGTFPSYPFEYQDSFVADALAAMNDFSALFFPDGALDRGGYREFFELPAEVRDAERARRIRERCLLLKAGPCVLAAEQMRNESARIRCVALCIETKPDWSLSPHVDRMLSQGTTRVELGVQSLKDEVLSGINRGHTLAESVEATRVLKDAFLKVGHHIMPGLPGSSSEEDIAMFRELFENPEYRPDSLKIYPCLVMPGTPLEHLYRRDEYTPLSTDEAARIVAEGKRFVPEYCRIMRVQRDIPSTRVLAGPKFTNLRQKVTSIMDREGRTCRCLRCREPRSRQPASEVLKTVRYAASGGEELFISIEDPELDAVLGYCRLRRPGSLSRPEIGARTAGIRELHVFGTATALGEQGGVQHRGHGKRLLQEAERLATEELGADELLVISGIGVREYYLRTGYRRKGPYMAKALNV